MTMDFFGHQELARRTTRRLILYFVLAVAGIVAAIYFVGVLLLRLLAGPGVDTWDPGLFTLVTVGVLAVVFVASAIKTANLRQGGAFVARQLGGTRVPENTLDPKQRMLLNVVEEMAIASGVPVPRVFVLDGEPGINAFAAGWGTSDAAVAVTGGSLDQLNRDELQGVIGHEFSHVFHGDMRLNIRLMGILFGIVCIATIGEIIVRSLGRSGVRSGGGKGKGVAAAIVLFGVALMVIGWIGVFFASLIKAAVSRQREFLADASSVAYTRNPLGIGMALARIGGLGSRVQNARAREASHMFFADGVQRWFGSLGATHPPIEQRVEAVLPGFLRELARGGSMVEAAHRTPVPAGAAGFAGGPMPASTPTVRSDAIPGFVGTLLPQFVQHARDLLAALPLDVVGAAREPLRARCLLYALLLERDDRAQSAVLQRLDPALVHEARALAASIQRLDHTVRLPLLELLVPSLRSLPADAIAALHADAKALALADDALSPFEFALLKTVRHHVPPPDAPPRRRPGRPVPLAALVRQAELVLSVLARAGGDEAEAADAFAQGARVLSGLPPITLRPAAECRLIGLDAALDALAMLSPLGKKLLLTACANAAGADGVVAAAEGELLRAFAEHLDCPLPPLWAPAGAPVV